MNLPKLEAEYEATIKTLSKQQKQIPIYRTRRKNPEIDMTYLAEMPGNPDMILYYGETLVEVMSWAEKNKLCYKFRSNGVH